MYMIFSGRLYLEGIIVDNILDEVMGYRKRKRYK